MLRLLLIFIAFGLPAIAQDIKFNTPRNSVSLPPPPIQIYVLVDGQQVGPMDEEKFKETLPNPAAAASTYVWMPGMPQWELASTVPQLQGIIASIGQGDSGGAFTVSDIQSYALGVWISERFVWTLGETDYSAIIQMKLLPDGKFEGATLLWTRDAPNPKMNVMHEKGQWTLAAQESGGNSFLFERNYTFSQVFGDEIVDTGQSSESFVLTPTSPNELTAEEGFVFIRIPEAS